MATVQGVLEAALSRVAGTPADTTCAGRTDAGVHALAQVVGWPDAPDTLDLEGLVASLNSICGPHIAIHSCAAAPQGWHARFSARSRTYVYALLEGPAPHPFLTATTWHHLAPLDLAAMNEAAGHLLGEHDFSSFGRLPDPEAVPVRTVFDVTCTRSGDVIRMKVRANAFIQQMVRSFVGTLVRVGEGRIDPGDIPAILATRDRAAAGPVAPPHGLALVAVEYDEGWSTPATRFDRP